jgi:Zn-dependent protease with chaperone function
MGHSKYTHSLKRMVLYLIEVVSMFYIFTLFMKNENAFKFFGFTCKSVFVDTVLYFHMFEPLTSFFNVLLLVINRKFEFEADLFAC